MPRGITGAGVHDQPGRLVHHQHVGVLVHDLEGNVFGQGRGFHFGTHVQGHGFAATHGRAGPGGLAVQQGIAGLDPFSQAAAGKIREHLGQGLVETLARQRQGHGGLLQLEFGVIAFGNVWGVCWVHALLSPTIVLPAQAEAR